MNFNVVYTILTTRNIYTHTHTHTQIYNEWIQMEILSVSIVW